MFYGTLFMTTRRRRRRPTDDFATLLRCFSFSFALLISSFFTVVVNFLVWRVSDNWNVITVFFCYFTSFQFQYLTRAYNVFVLETARAILNSFFSFFFWWFSLNFDIDFGKNYRRVSRFKEKIFLPLWYWRKSWEGSVISVECGMFLKQLD